MRCHSVYTSWYVASITSHRGQWTTATSQSDICVRHANNVPKPHPQLQGVDEGFSLKVTRRSHHIISFLKQVSVHSGDTTNSLWEGQIDNGPTVHHHYSDVIMGAMAIISITIIYSTAYLGADKKLKLRVTGLCAGKPPVTGEFPAQMASNTENVSIWWRHHDYNYTLKQGCCVCQFWNPTGLRRM